MFTPLANLRIEIEFDYTDYSQLPGKKVEYRIWINDSHFTHKIALLLFVISIAFFHQLITIRLLLDKILPSLQMNRNATISSRVYGRGNVFVVSACVSVYLCVCVSVCLYVSGCICLSVRAMTFEGVDIETSFSVWCYILTILTGSSLSIKVIGSKSRSSHGKC